MAHFEVANACAPCQPLFQTASCTVGQQNSNLQSQVARLHMTTLAFGAAVMLVAVSSTTCGCTGC